MRSNLDIFSDDQAITADAVSTNYVDVGKHAGKGEPVPIRVRVTEAFNNLTSLSISIQECDTVDGTYTDVTSTHDILLADLALGDETVIRFLPKVTDRYIKLHYDVTGTAPSTGKFAAEVVSGEDFPFVDGLFFSPRNSSGAESTA